MKNWYASVNYGLESIVGDMLSSDGAENIKISESALTFTFPHEINRKCINNLFSIILSFHSESIEAAAKKISHSSLRFPHLNGNTFRIIIMDCGKLRSIPKNIMAEIEKIVSRQTKLSAYRANPDIEIWLNRRNNGSTYFMVRVKKHTSFDKSLKKGELHPDIVDVMLYKAEINKQSIVADLFGGWGAVALAVSESGQYKKMYTGDINEECVQYQKARLQKKHNCIVQKWDSMMLPLADTTIDSIITDPPWGEYSDIDTARLYDGFIEEAARILRPAGTLVFLSSALNDSCKPLEKYNFNYSYTPLKISGKDTYLFCAKKNGADEQN